VFADPLLRLGTDSLAAVQLLVIGNNSKDAAVQIQPGETCVAHLLTALAMLVVVHLAGAGCMTMLLVNDAHHMTVERATTPRVPTRFRVLDAETAQPVAGARVVAMHNFDWMSDWFVEGTTDDAGVAVLRLYKPHVQGVQVHVYADGYIDRHDLALGQSPGTKPHTSDPLDILVYREPPAGVGWRFPEGFRGTVVVGSTGRQDFGETVLVGSEQSPEGTFRVPPAFPPGQRIWWSDIEPGLVNYVKRAPSLGGEGGDMYAIPEAVTIGGRLVPIPEPGTELDGVAVWHVGVYMPDGPWGGRYDVLVIGERADALAKVKAMFDAHGGNGPAAWIFNGWLRHISPGTRLSSPQPYGVTHTK
jgi:hypothetical protein